MLTIVCLSSMAMASYAQSKSESHTLPPEVKRTVDALVGHWSFKGSDAEPGIKEPLSVSMEIDCQLAVFGAAVTCTLRGNVANSGPIEAATIVGYDPTSRLCTGWRFPQPVNTPRPQREMEGRDDRVRAVGLHERR
jgi:hypothetical protein